MYLLRAELHGLGPFEHLTLAFTDEVDLYQDPAVAIQLPSALRAALPTVQSILTTSSQALVAGAAPGEVLALRASSDGGVELHAGPSATTH